MRQRRGEVGLPVIDEAQRVQWVQPTFARRSVWNRPMPRWAGWIFWITLLSPIILVLLYVGALWMIFVIVMAACTMILGGGKRRGRRRRRKW